ncbi:hypothetical protein ABIB56_000615 [Glaciihabitans sp. UYNi722]
MTEGSAEGGQLLRDATALTMLRIRPFARFRINPAAYRETRAVDVRAWAVGSRWDRPWDTVWFDVRGKVPTEWAAGEAELVVDLGFTGTQPGFQAEATVYRIDGSIVKAIEPLNSWVPVSEPGSFRFLVEAAANPMLQVPYGYEPTLLGDRATSGGEPHYRLERLELARRDLVVGELLQDVATLDGLVDVLPCEGMRRGGDGGGGTREMLAQAARKRDLEGSPRVELSDSHSFFRAAEAELTHPAVWVGELHACIPAQDETGQPPQRGTLAAGRGAGVDGRHPARYAVSRGPVEGRLAYGIAPAVPRHPARHLDRVDSSGCRGGVRAGRGVAR